MVEGRNVLHHNKKEGKLSGGNCSGGYGQEECPDPDCTAFLLAGRFLSHVDNLHLNQYILIYLFTPQEARNQGTSDDALELRHERVTNRQTRIILKLHGQPRIWRRLSKREHYLVRKSFEFN